EVRRVAHVADRLLRRDRGAAAGLDLLQRRVDVVDVDGDNGCGDVALALQHAAVDEARLGGPLVARRPCGDQGVAHLGLAGQLPRRPSTRLGAWRTLTGTTSCLPRHSLARHALDATLATAGAFPARSETMGACPPQPPAATSSYSARPVRSVPRRSTWCAPTR